MSRSSNRINLVYLGDGYTEAEMNTFITDAQTVNSRLFETVPFKQYRHYFNAFAIRVPSAELGAVHAKTATDCPSDQPVTSPKTYFGSRFDVGNIHRLVVPDSTSKILSVLAANVPNYTQSMLIANSNYYGGSGGVFATTTRHTSAYEIAIHELGHSFAGLADEYWAGSVYATEKPNMTAQSNPQLVKWKAWVGTNSIHVYPYAGGAGWYRPVQNSQCKMEVLGVPFCNVCAEAIIQKIHALVKPVDSYFPLSTTLTNPVSDLGFRVNLIAPEPNTLKVQWILDGVVVANNADTLNIKREQLQQSHTVKAIVVDTSAMLRTENHFSAHIQTVQWNINVATGVLSPEIAAAQVKVFPNPFSSYLNIRYFLEKNAQVKVELYNQQGVLVHRSNKGRQNAGKHLITIRTQKNIPDGTYFVVFYPNGDKATEGMIKIGQ